MSGTVAYRQIPITPQQMREDFHEFLDTSLYPNEKLYLYLNIANAMFDAGRWGELQGLGIELWVAHYLTLDRQSELSGASGGIAGAAVGMVASKSVGGASISYDIASSTERDGGHWNSTAYGRRWLNLARMVGAGGIQLGGFMFPAGTVHGS